MFGGHILMLSYSRLSVCYASETFNIHLKICNYIDKKIFKGIEQYKVEFESAKLRIIKN